jgi:hypothetical protein
VSFLVRRPPGLEGEPKVYYPQALVVLTISMETLRDEGAVPRSKFGGALVDPEAKTVDVAVRPLSFRVQRNSYQQPDTFDAEMDVRALPLTPKQIRACNASLLLWSSREPGVPTDAAGNVLVRPLFEGLVDEVTANYEDDGHTVQISGQDYTALFTQRQWDPRRRAPAGKRLDVHLEELLAEEQGAGAVVTLRVEPETLRASLPFVGAKAVRTNKRGKPVAEKSSWWDVMYEMALGEGYIIFVEGTEVVLTRPHVLHESRAGVAERVSDAAALSLQGKRRPVFSFAWGRNLTRLEIQRNFGKEAQPIVEVVGYNPSTRRRLTARYPAKGQKASVGVGTDPQKIDRHVLEGVASEDVLRQYARNLYELRAKGEQSIALGTEDMTDLKGQDLLDMRAGDAAGLDIDVFNTAELLRADESTRMRLLEAAGFPPNVVAYVARNMDVVDQLKGPFRVREATIEFSADDGVAIDAELQEFVRGVPQEAV